MNEDVLAAAAHLVGRFAAHDRAGYFACFAPQASFIFHGTREFLPTRAAYEALWRRWESEDGFRVLACHSFEQRAEVFSDIAVFTHKVETRLAFGADEQSSVERETIIFQRQPDGGWLAVHEHLSTYDFT